MYKDSLLLITLLAEMILDCRGFRIDSSDNKEIINDTEKTSENYAKILGRIVEIDKERISFSIRVMRECKLEEVMDDEELIQLIISHLTCSEEEFVKMRENI